MLPYEAGLKPQRDGKPCAGCGRPASSNWYGPEMAYCSKRSCRKLAVEAREAFGGGGPKDRRVAELEGKVDALEEQSSELKTRISEQAGLIASMQRQLARLAQVPRGGAAAHAPLCTRHVRRRAGLLM